MWWPLSITLVKGTRATFITVLTTGAILKVFFRDNFQILGSIYKTSTVAVGQLTIPSLSHAESYRDFGKLGHSLHIRVADKFRLELIHSGHPTLHRSLHPAFRSSASPTQSSRSFAIPSINSQGQSQYGQGQPVGQFA